MPEEKRRPDADPAAADSTQQDGPSTNREQVPGGLEGSIMEPDDEHADADNAGRRPSGNERRTDEL